MSVKSACCEEHGVQDGEVKSYRSVRYDATCCGEKLDWQESIGDPNGASCLATCAKCSRMWLMVPHTVQLLERLPGSSQLIKAVFAVPAK